MSLQSNASQSAPQADGDSRPFRLPADTAGPVMVHTEKSGPAFRVQRRDADLASLVEPIARLLYRAMQIHAIGAIDNVLFEELPGATTAQLAKDARTAMNLQSSLYRELAARKAKHAFHDALKDAQFHYPHLNPVADAREQQAREAAIAHVAQFMGLLEIPALMLDTYQRTLTEALPMAATSQVALTAMRGARDGF